MHRHRDYRPDDETGGLLRTARVSVRAGRMLGAGLDPVELGPSGRLVLEVHLVDVDVGDLGRRDVLLGEDRVDGARIDACTAIDALIRVDENHPVIVGLVDAVHGADLDAGLVLQVDASLSDDVGHAGWSLAKAEALSSIARGKAPCPARGQGAHGVALGYRPGQMSATAPCPPGLKGETRLRQSCTGTGRGSATVRWARAAVHGVPQGGRSSMAKPQ